MKTAYLKVKIKSLAEEARIIRRMENDLKAKGPHNLEARDTFWGLRNHRTNDVRNEARAAQLAYGFLRGRDYRQLESKSYSTPPLKRTTDLIRKYGRPGDKLHIKDVERWLDGEQTAAA